MAEPTWDASLAEEAVLPEQDAFRLVGMLHLPPLPGIPNYPGTPLATIIDQAVADAATLTAAGFTHLLLQNASDAPAETTVAPSTLTVMTRIGTEVARATSLPLGVNVAHNDGPGAVAVAHAIGATYVRVKLLTGAAVGPAGIMAGCGRQTAELRALLGADLEIWGDVQESTSLPLVPADPVWSATEAVKFGGADALVVTRDSGVPDALETIEAIRRVLPGVPLLVGGRVTETTIAVTRARADGAIIGGAVKTGPGWFDRVDLGRARRLAHTTHPPAAPGLGY